jgi:hypothetical protein
MGQLSEGLSPARAMSWCVATVFSRSGRRSRIAFSSGASGAMLSSLRINAAVGSLRLLSVCRTFCCSSAKMLNHATPKGNSLDACRAEC